MKKIFGLFRIKLKHPTAKVLIRRFPDESNKVYYELNTSTIWYCLAANEIIIDINS